MHKSELIGALAKEKGLSRSKAKEVIDLFFNEMSSVLVNGERVEIRGLFSMFVKDHKAYTARNPKTKEAVQVPEKKLPFFKCGRRRTDGHK